jgi:hypothetical protein
VQGPEITPRKEHETRVSDGGKLGGLVLKVRSAPAHLGRRQHAARPCTLRGTAATVVLGVTRARRVQFPQVAESFRVVRDAFLARAKPVPGFAPTGHKSDIVRMAISHADLLTILRQLSMGAIADDEIVRAAVPPLPPPCSRWRAGPVGNIPDRFGWLARVPHRHGQLLRDGPRRRARR